MTNQRPPLTEDLRRQFSGLILLDRVVTDPEAYHAALLEGDDAFLEPVFRYLQGEDLAEVGEGDHFRPTPKGLAAYRKLIDQRRSYLANYEIFASVDLAEGAFGDPNSPLEDPRWSDLRVAVAEYKGIDPYRIVFLAMLSDEAFFQGAEWKFDLALGSKFFQELDEIVTSQIAVDELGYQSEEGESISGEAVIDDVILQGANENKDRWEREQRNQQSLVEEEEAQRRDDNGEPETEEQWVYAPYDPWQPMAMYAGSALFVEAMWLSAYW